MKSLFEFYLKDFDQSFNGWDFSYITSTGRMQESPLSWSYTTKVLKKLREAKNMLDMGTGGGEYLSKLKPLPQNTYASEGYMKNIPIARARLEPLGVNVVKVGEENKLDFADNFFDLIINRHGEYSPEEVYRVLQTDSYFITQQVGGQNCLELNRFLDSEQDFGMLDWKLNYAQNQLEEAGFEIIEAKEDFPFLRFFDIGAVVYYLKAVPWQIPDFSIKKYYNKLKNLHKKIMKNDYLDIKEHRFLIVAKKV
ncbi:MAG: methyltransferase domain-containing protein [Candidatus Cloacimonetes bacterium]|nr:methyltransferase domain-containing protein [Candidatus Cloacimonadota bacterium]